jgi:hypothetical protein
MLIFVLLAVTYSCKTTKNSVKETTKAQTYVANDVKQTSEATGKTSTSENVTDKTTSADSIVVNVVDVVWSKPDSSGKQYPEKTTYRNEIHTQKTKADVATNKQINAEESNKAENIDKSKANSNVLTDKKETEKTAVKTPAWVYAAAAVVSLGLLVLLYFVLRRFGLIK